MLESHLPDKPNNPPSEHELRSDELLLHQRTADIGYPGLPHYDQFTDPLSGTEQIAKLLDLLFRRKWSVVTGFLVVIAVSLIYTINLTPEFETSSFVIVDLGKVSIDVTRRVTPPEEGQDSGFELFARSDRSLTGEIRLLEISDQLAQRVNQRLQENTAAIADEANDAVLPPWGQVRFASEQGSDNILRLTGRSSNAEHAMLLANLYAEEYVRLTRDASRSQVYAIRESLQETEKRQFDELTGIEEQINRYKQNGITNLDAESARLTQLIATTDIERENALIELQVEKTTLVSLENELEVINPQLAQRIASGVERRLQTLQEQLAEDEDARSKFLLENPELRGRETNALRSLDDRIQRLKSEIDTLSLQYVQEVAASGGISGGTNGLSYVANLRQQIAERRVNVNRMEAMLEALDKRINDYQTAIQKLPGQSKELAQLERSRLRAEMKYQNTSDQLQAAYVAEESEPGYAQIIRKAELPLRSVYPDVSKNLILGGFFGLLIGLGLAIVREKIDNRLYQPEQLRLMGLREIGVIPNMKLLIKKNYKGNTTINYNGLNVSTSLISLLDRWSAEPYRYLRTQIRFGVPDAPVQTLLITSPGVSEGKSTTAANLAVVMAQTGRKTLLMDADLRRPKIHRIFGLPLDAGIIENLTDELYFTPDAWKSCIENLFILTAGNPIVHEDGNKKESNKNENLNERIVVLNPSEILESAQMRQIFAKLRKRFDIIIIDSPPVLVATDASVLAAQSDATIVVARSGVTKEGEMDRAIETLNSVGATIIGVLLNAFDIKKAFGHKYKYQNYTQYGQYSQYGYHEVRDK